MSSSRMGQSTLTLRSRQLNPCDVLFWKSRGYPTRPGNWQDLLWAMGYYSSDTENDDDDYEQGYDSEEDYEEGDYEEESYEEDHEYYDEEYEEDPEYYDEEYDEDREEYDDEEYDSDYEEHRENSNANNPNNDVFWQRRGYEYRPDNWKELRAVYGF